MKIALIGYGSTGRLIATLAEPQGHQIQSVTTSANAAQLPAQLSGADVAIDFSQAEAVSDNVKACVTAKVPLVVGTTGWQRQLEEAQRIVAEHDGALLYGANFSLGVNLFYLLVKRAAELFARPGGYEPFIEEAHHSRKKDAPSGTALKLRDIVAANFPKEFTIAATRAGHIPGTHRVGFDSAADTVTLTHTARTREGFALGALMAAQWIIGKRGFYEFTEALDEIIAAKQD